MSNVNPQSNNLKTIPPNDTDKKTEDKPEEQTKSAAPLEEDDEFEDFPVEGRFHCRAIQAYENRLDRSRVTITVYETDRRR